MSRLMQGDCVEIMSRFPGEAVDFILTDPPYLVNYRDRSGRSIAGDKTDEWLQPACDQMFRVLKRDSLMVSFYGWNAADKFVGAWKAAGFRVVGHLVFAKPYASKSAFVGYAHESAYLLAKGRPPLPASPLPDVMSWKYTGNRHHPTEKPVSCLQPLIESFTSPAGKCWTPSRALHQPVLPLRYLVVGMSGSNCCRNITLRASDVWLRFVVPCWPLPLMTNCRRLHDELFRA